MGQWGDIGKQKVRMYSWCQKNIPIYFKLTRLIVIDIVWSPVISVCDCHLIHGNNIGPFSATATKYLHWALVCKKILSENFRTNFPSTFCKGASFLTTFCNVDKFSLGPVFIEPCSIVCVWAPVVGSTKWVFLFWSQAGGRCVVSWPRVRPS